MIPENFKEFGGGSGETTIHPLVLAILIVSILAIWFLPKRYVLIPFVVVMLLVPLGDQVVFIGVHFPIMRIVILFTWLRWVRVLKWNKVTTLDKIVVAWLIVGTITYTVLWASVGALISKLGFVYNAIGVYFIFRWFVSDRSSSLRLVHILAIVSVVIAGLMLVEALNGHNLLAAIGGSEWADLRQGRYRAQGPFVHSIIAGTVGAILMPMFVGLWSVRDSRNYAFVGVLATTVVTVTSASSTPIAAYCAGVVGLCFWLFRQHMRLIRWIIAIILVVLHVVMKAPVWSLVGRFEFMGGSSGWHRFLLVDQYIRHVSEWWFVGTRNNASWGYDMWDKANWYVQSGISGGLPTFILFVSLIVYGFRVVGKARQRCKTSRNGEFLVWGLGSSLFASAISFVGINLIDQSIVVWFAVLALLAGASSGALDRPAGEKPAGNAQIGAIPCITRAISFV
jgi:hypothetical protein